MPKADREGVLDRHQGARVDQADRAPPQVHVVGLECFETSVRVAHRPWVRSAENSPSAWSIRTQSDGLPSTQDQVAPEREPAVRPHGDSEPVGEALAPGRGRGLGIGIQEQHPRTPCGRMPLRVSVGCGSAGQTHRAADGEAGLARSALAMPEGDAWQG
jgi:hypothetical protein